MEKWTNKFSFWMALIGSAVGLGNIWRFSYLLYEYGPLFLVFYIIGIFLIGIPIMCLELILSKKYSLPIKELFKKHGVLPFSDKWPALIFSLFFILGSYYAIVVAQTASYGFGLQELLALVIIWLASLSVVFIGIKGIETINNGLMLILVLMLLYLLFSISPGITEIINLTGKGNLIETMASAFAQVLFSLSVGAGMTYTYSIYAKRDFNVVKTASIVAAFDVAIAIISAMIIFSLPSEEGIWVAFSSLSEIIQREAGVLGKYSLFIALFSAGFTSLIAIVKVIYDNWGKKAAILQATTSLALAIFFSDKIQFLDQYVITYLFLIMLPFNAFTFYKLAVHGRRRVPPKL